MIDGWNYSDDGLEGLEINVLIVNEDGTITFVLYQPRTPACAAHELGRINSILDILLSYFI